MAKQYETEPQAGEIEHEPSAHPADIRTGFFSGPGIRNKAVEYVAVDGVALCEGCIELGAVEEVERAAAAHRARREASDRPAATAGATDERSDPSALMGVGLPQDSEFLWTNGRMPFVINTNLPDDDRVREAMTHWTENTGMRFVERTAANAAQHPNHVEFVRNPGVNWSSSQIGMRGGRQLIRVSDAASVGTIVHEIAHAFGHYHEQSRSDRDDFVTINWQNITSGFESNFQKQLSPNASDYYDYDYGSIMHYPTWAFSKNNQATIAPTQTGVTIGQRTGLSFGDRLTNAKMYERFFTKGHTGVWRQGTGRYALWVNAPWSSFRDRWQSWSRDGLRLVDLNVHRRGGQTRYSGVFEAGSGAYALWANVPWDDFRAKWEEWNRQGLRLIDINVHRHNGQNRYSGVWRAGSGPYALWANASWESFRAKWQEYAGRGLRLADVHANDVNGTTRYSGVWLPGHGAYGLWANATWASFVAKWREWSGNGLRLVDVNVHRRNGQNRYTGTFAAGAGGYYLWANVTWENFRAKWQQLGVDGLRLVDYEFVHTGSGPSADADDPDRAPTLASADVFGAAADDLEAVGVATATDLRPEPFAAVGAADLAGGVGGVHVATTAGPSTGGPMETEAGLGGAVFEGPAATTGDDGGVGGAVFGSDHADAEALPAPDDGQGMAVV